jgi:pimeloyl-ACP methyl ester carboxylesterase
MVFVHGAWHSSEFYSRIIAILEPLGYKCVTVAMPSVGNSPPVSSLDEDIKAIREVVVRELDSGSDVIVNIHSWAGIPANSALDGLSKTERQSGQPGVIKLTFIASFLLPEGLVSMLVSFFNNIPSADSYQIFLERLFYPIL